MTYCEFAAGHPLHGPYHDLEYGFYQTDESVLFERLILEINQAGLSWETILKKRDGLKAAYSGFDVVQVASYGDTDRTRLLNDPNIIRNRAKIEAAIHNANVIVNMRESHGGFSAWLNEYHPLSKLEWIKLFKRTFKFTGGEITNEFLMSLGYLPGAHDENCWVRAQIVESNPVGFRH